MIITRLHKFLQVCIRVNSYCLDRSNSFAMPLSLIGSQTCERFENAARELFVAAAAAAFDRRRHSTIHW